MKLNEPEKTEIFGAIFSMCLAIVLGLYSLFNVIYGAWAGFHLHDWSKGTFLLAFALIIDRSTKSLLEGAKKKMGMD